ncbi:AbrB family transcriptional regulator [Cohnella thermotolerans]|uniref:AbrB family transcriptional regulator n=1 Tax=Cohnella thermotolerans TaxID=329858 RepID=UPI0003FF3B8E|nr:AbrB family transcriptional regulator [Cohnella thermotolerans]
MKKDLHGSRPWTRFVLTLATAVVGGFVFKLLHLPIPWLLGPMIAALIGSNLLQGRYAWPGRIRNGGMIVVGYTIGLAMTSTALREMLHQLPSMLLMTVLLLLFCACMAFVVSKLSDTDYRTALLGSIPGGLTQVVTLAEETEGINLTVVTVTQVIRLMMIIICVPLLVFSPIFDATGNAATDTASAVVRTAAASWSGLWPNGLVFAAVCVVLALLGNKIKFPTAFLLGPAIGTAILQLSSGLHGPALPTALINAAQLAIGTNVGLMLKPGRLTHKVRTFSLAIGSALVLIIGALGLAYLLTKLQSVSAATGLLSLAPGGMDQMGIIAHEIGADLSMVAGYQLFRTFFIFLAVPPLIRLLFRLSDGRAAQRQGSR